MHIIQAFENAIFEQFAVLDKISTDIASRAVPLRYLSLVVLKLLPEQTHIGGGKSLKVGGKNGDLRAVPPAGVHGQTKLATRQLLGAR